MVFLTILFIPLCILALISRILHCAWNTTLRDIPNAHPLAPYTGLWMLWVRYRERVNITVYKAHKLYGPVVRLGPRELSIATYEDGVETVYSSKKFAKHDFYKTFSNFRTTPMFATVDPKVHTEKRKRAAGVYTKSYIQTSPHLKPIMSEILLGRLMPRLVLAQQKCIPIDMLATCQAITLDTITAYFWGLKVGSNFLDDDAARLAWHEMYIRGRPLEMFFLPVEVPFLTRLLAKLNLSPLPSTAAYHSDMLDAWFLERCDRADSLLEHSNSTIAGDYPTVYNQLKLAAAKETVVAPLSHSSLYRTFPTNLKRHKQLDYGILSRITKDRPHEQIEAAAELLDELVAANEVLSLSLTYICWRLSQRPEWQAKLRDELHAVTGRMERSSDRPMLLPSADLDRCPVLHAIIQETLRLDAMNPGQEPRIVTPECGTVRLGEFGNIPHGTRVSSLPYVLHRDTSAFPQPDLWQPERWLLSPERSNTWAGNGEADRYFWAFSSGPRMCIGSHLAMHVMQLTVATIYDKFTTSIVEDRGMDETTDGFMVVPKAEQLLLKFRRWDL